VCVSCVLLYRAGTEIWPASQVLLLSGDTCRAETKRKVLPLVLDIHGRVNWTGPARRPEVLQQISYASHRMPRRRAASTKSLPALSYLRQRSCAYDGRWNGSRTCSRKERSLTRAGKAPRCRRVKESGNYFDFVFCSDLLARFCRTSCVAQFALLATVVLSQHV